MAKAGDDDSTIYTPPGFRKLTEVVATDGLETVRDRHASGEPAFGLSLHTGKMVEIPRELWRTHSALEVLEFGIWYRHDDRRHGPYSFGARPRYEEFVVLVADKPEPAESPPPLAPVKLSPPKWWAQFRETHPRRLDEPAEEYIARMDDEMQTAKDRGEVTRLWPIETWQRRIYDKK